MTEALAIKPTGWGTSVPPFHDAELAVQQRAGVAEEADRSGRRGIRRYMPEQHRQFFLEQPFMVPLEGSWREGSMIGGLGLQAHTRRRNRINGVVSSVNGGTVTLDVLQSFGNCAKYIQGHTPKFITRDPVDVSREVEHATQLDAADRALLSRADTFFIASANLPSDAMLARGADVSHSGGMPGLVCVDDANTLTTPDFTGNCFFNTLGNLVHDPRAGLLFVDFERGDLLALRCRARGDHLGRPGTRRIPARRVARALSHHRSSPRSRELAVSLVGCRIRAAICGAEGYAGTGKRGRVAVEKAARGRRAR